MLKGFIGYFFKVTKALSSIYLLLIGLMVGGGFIISMTEKLPLGQSLYFAFITGLTIGYGDIVPKTYTGMLVAILLGLIGILFTGINVAVAVHSIQKAAQDSTVAEKPVNHD